MKNWVLCTFFCEPSYRSFFIEILSFCQLLLGENPPFNFVLPYLKYLGMTCIPCCRNFKTGSQYIQVKYLMNYLTNNINTISFMTQMQAAQINELNSIMACVAMFASSMVVSSQPIIIIQNSLNNVNTTLTPDSSISSSPTGEGESSGIDGTSPHSPGPSMIIHQNKMKSTTTTSVKSPTQSSSSSAIIIDSIMVLLEPLMLCSGGITFTMRYFLNEISSKIKKNYFKSLPFSSLAINGGR